MSARPRPTTATDPALALTEAALRHLIDDHGADLHPGILALIGGYYGVVRHGYALKPGQIATISAIRAEIAWKALRAPAVLISENWNGAA